MYIVLMAGGVGTRFWPRSRKAFPKQLLNIIGDKSMLQLTFDRVKTLTTPEKILIITNIEQKKHIHKQIPEIPEKNVIAEPFGKNTAPCIGLAAAIIKKRSKTDQVMVVLPADHLVGDIEDFQKTILFGVKYAEKNPCLITLGITPIYPETGYGYIQSGDVIAKIDDKDIFRVKTFAEKPNYETAERFLKSGDFFWNSGMFIWSTDSIIANIDECLPELGMDLREIEKHVDTKDFADTVLKVYKRTKAISIDYGVMENAREVCVIKSDFKWNDLGSWEAVYNISPKDQAGNAVTAKDSVIINSKNNYLYTNKKLIAMVDIDDLVVVEMDDALLICKRQQSQNIKSIVEYLNSNDMEEYL